MRIHRKDLMGFVVVVTVLLLGCEMVCGRLAGREISEPRPTARAGKVIDPANIQLDLEAEGLKVWWRQDIGQVAGGKNLRHIYLLDNLLAAETLDGTLFYFDATTGVWTGITRLKSSLLAPPAIHEKTLYAVSGRALLMVNRESGLIEKRLLAQMPVSCQPLPFYDFLILSGGNGDIVCLDPQEDGRRIWRVRAGGSVDEPPLLRDARIYAVGYKGKVVAIPVHTGIVRWDWRPKAPSKLISGLALAEGYLSVGDNRGFVYRLTAEDGIFVWKYPAGAPVVATAPIGEKLLVFTHRGGVLCLDVAGVEPELLWKHPDGLKLIATGKRDVYMLTSDRCVTCVSLKSGKEKWRLPLAEDCAVVSEPSEPAFYVSQARGAIMAIRELD